MANKEIRSLTGIRGIAALYVVIYHLLLHVPAVNQLPVIGYFISHGYLAVDLFFILSGFVITLSAHNTFNSSVTLFNYKSFMKKRFVRIYPAYFVVFILTCIFITHFHPLSSIVLSFFLISILSPRAQVLAVFWSLSSEWLIYLVFPLWIKFLGSGKTLKLYSLLLIFILLDGYIYFKFFNTDRIFDQYFLPGALIRAVGAYSLGMFAYYTKNAVLKYYWLSDVYFIFIILSCSFNKLDLVAIIFSGLLIRNLYGENRSIISKICSGRIGYWLGVISYSLYLIHQFIQNIFRIYLPSFQQQHLLLSISCYFVLSIITAALLNRYFEMPLSNLLRKKILHQSASISH